MDKLRKSHATALRLLAQYIEDTMPASRADSKAIVALNQAFLDHVRDEERRFDEMAKTMKSVACLEPMLARLEVQSKYNGEGIDKLVVKVSEQNGRIGKLERWKAWILGMLLIVGGLAGYVVEHVMKGNSP